MPDAVKPIPEGYGSVTPYLIMKDAARAIEFYKQAFGATETERMDAPGGKIGHAEMLIGDSHIMLADEFPDMGYRGPEALGGSPIGLMLYIENVDSVVERAVAAGAKLLQPIENKFYGDRSGEVEDPFGHRWTVSTHIEDVSPEEMKKRIAAFENAAPS